MYAKRSKAHFSLTLFWFLRVRIANKKKLKKRRPLSIQTYRFKVSTLFSPEKVVNVLVPSIKIIPPVQLSTSQLMNWQWRSRSDLPPSTGLTYHLLQVERQSSPIPTNMTSRNLTLCRSITHRQKNRVLVQLHPKRTMPPWFLDVSVINFPFNCGTDGAWCKYMNELLALKNLKRNRSASPGKTFSEPLSNNRNCQNPKQKNTSSFTTETHRQFLTTTLTTPPKLVHSFSLKELKSSWKEEK